MRKSCAFKSVSKHASRVRWQAVAILQSSIASEYVHICRRPLQYSSRPVVLEGKSICSHRIRCPCPSAFCSVAEVCCACLLHRVCELVCVCVCVQIVFVHSNVACVCNVLRVREFVYVLACAIAGCAVCACVRAPFSAGCIGSRVDRMFCRASVSRFACVCERAWVRLFLSDRRSEMQTQAASDELDVAPRC